MVFTVDHRLLLEEIRYRGIARLAVGKSLFSNADMQQAQDTSHTT